MKINLKSSSTIWVSLFFVLQNLYTNGKKSEMDLFKQILMESIWVRVDILVNSDLTGWKRFYGTSCPS